MRKKIAWNRAPLFVGTIVTARGLRLVAQQIEEIDLIEVRVDALLAVSVDPEKILDFLRVRKNPVLLTLRLPEEGGQYSWHKGEREALFTSLLPDVDAVDIELASIKKLHTIRTLAERLGVDLILSAHSIQEPVTAPQLKKWVNDFVQLKPALAKIAARVNRRQELQPLAKVLLSDHDQRWAIMGLGPLGALSRVVFGGLGSALIYGYLDKAAAPGQPSIRQLRSKRPI